MRFAETLNYKTSPRTPAELWKDTKVLAGEQGEHEEETQIRIWLLEWKCVTRPSNVKEDILSDLLNTKG